MWPSVMPSDDTLTHGILENGIHFDGRFGETYEAPTDWTIYV